MERKQRRQQAYKDHGGEAGVMKDLGVGVGRSGEFYWGPVRARVEPL